jgi:glucosamine 6-phosphate synthetase-like amidotransferase/phosphosugar isomerase protein
MCGIASILLHPQERPVEIWQAIKDTFTRNLLFNEERGREATGVAVVQSDGQVFVQKLQLSATQFVATVEYHALLDKVNAQTTLLLGHARHPTKGTPQHNENNHPLQAGPVFGVHNGHIDNDDALFAACHCPRQAEVDSEIIFRLLEPLSPVQLNGNYLTKACSMLQQLQGKFTFLSCHQDAPEKLLLVKHQNPLSLHYHDFWNVLIFSSRYLFLRKTFGPAISAEKIPCNQLMLFDAHLLPQLGWHPLDSMPLFADITGA